MLERRLRVLRHLTDRVVRRAGDLRADDAKLEQLLVEVGAAAPEEQDTVPRRDELVDQGPFLSKLRQHFPVIHDGADVHRGVGPLDGQDVAARKERRGSLAERGRVCFRIGGVAVGLQQNVLDVALRKATLPGRDVDDERGVPLPGRGPGVVPDDQSDQDQEEGDDQAEALVESKARDPTALRHRSSLRARCACRPDSGPPGCRTGRSDPAEDSAAP